MIISNYYHVAYQRPTLIEIIAKIFIIIQSLPVKINDEFKESINK